MSRSFLMLVDYNIFHTADGHRERKGEKISNNDEYFLYCRLHKIRLEKKNIGCHDGLGSSSCRICSSSSSVVQASRTHSNNGSMVFETSPEELMRAIVYARHSNDPNVLELQMVPRPALQPHQVLIRVKAAAINPVDFKFRRNPVPNFIVPKPKIPGADVSGEIVELGKKIENWNVGDRVVAMLPLLMSPWGTLAEYVAVDGKLVARVADGVDLEEAASLPLVALTVVQAFQPIPSDELRGKKILIQAGAGGVGTFAIQYAKHVLGMYVATTASQRKAGILSSLGADQVIDYSSTKFEDVIQDFDVVLDPMSWSYEKRTLSSKVLKPSGHYISIASSDWLLHDGREKTNGFKSFLNMLYHKFCNLFKSGLLPDYTFAVVHPEGKQLQEVMDLVENSIVKPVVDRRFALSHAVGAFAYLEEGHATGKVIICMDTVNTDVPV